jgi:hypothetical protein
MPYVIKLPMQSQCMANRSPCAVCGGLDCADLGRTNCLHCGYATSTSAVYNSVMILFACAGCWVSQPLSHVYQPPILLHFATFKPAYHTAALCNI